MTDPKPGNLSEYFILHVCIVAWSQAEIIRFSFYTFPQLGFTGAREGILGHLRYNMFLVMYPLGVGAELLCMWDAKKRVTAMQEDIRPWTTLMPNDLNIEFRYEWAVWL